MLRTYMGRYEAKRLLGEGGMGRVYLAREYDAERVVVVKVMHEHLVGDPKFRERFLRETRTMLRLNHPHAVKLLDASLDDPAGPCIVMEYIRGVRLDELLKENKRFTPARTCRLVGQVCDVLAAAHDLGIIHRDLKPANLMVVDADSPEEQVKVMDFGLAKIADPKNKQPAKKITDTGLDFALGTPSYISPEQVRGEQVDQRSDLYSVGVIAYELLSGRLPFTAASNMDMILSHATEKPPTFAELGMGNWVPRAIEQVVLSCLEKSPDARPASAQELATRFEEALACPDEEPVEEAPAPARSRSTLIDPDAMAYTIEAWLPQKIALVKIRGFVHDAGGEVIKSGPGLIRVRLGARAPAATQYGFSVLKFGRRNPWTGPMEIEMRLQQLDPDKDNKLRVTILFHAPDQTTERQLGWRERCNRLFCEVRAYLMGSSEG